MQQTEYMYIVQKAEIKRPIQMLHVNSREM